MALLLKKSSMKAGLPPGTLVHVGEKKAEKVRIRLIEYDEQGIRETELEPGHDFSPPEDRPAVTWINIDGLWDVELIERVGLAFGLHSLALEDIVNTNQRPKMDDYEEYLFLVSKMISYDASLRSLQSEQLSIVLGKHFLLTFQERPGDIFDPIRQRLRNGKGRIRKMGPDYLAYALLDAVVDNYFLALENVGENVEELEDEILENPGTSTVQRVHGLKMDLLFLRKSVWPLREIIGGVEREESDLIERKTTLFLRDLYDHTIQVIDTVETYRDTVTGLLDIYLSSLSNKLNEIMKVLTIIATLFIPLTLIAGIYGMNFKFMPELEWKWGYPLVILLMVVLAGIMLAWFRKKRLM